MPDKLDLVSLKIVSGTIGIADEVGHDYQLRGEITIKTEGENYEVIKAQTKGGSITEYNSLGNNRTFSENPARFVSATWFVISPPAPGQQPVSTEILISSEFDKHNPDILHVEWSSEHDNVRFRAIHFMLVGTAHK